MASIWTEDEEQEFIRLLDKYVMEEGLSLYKSLDKISNDLGRTPTSYMNRWQKSLRTRFIGTELFDRIILNFNGPSIKDYNARISDETIKGGMKNRYEIRGDVTVIYLDIRGKPFKETLIDTNDLDKANEPYTTWYAYFDKNSNNYYVRGNICGGGKIKTIQLHRVLTSAPKGKHVDHYDGNTLNNRRLTNLKIVTHAENRQNGKTPKNNKSGAKNVHWVKSQKKWRVLIKVNHIIVINKDYDTFEEAVEVAKKVREEKSYYNPNRIVS